MPKMTIRQFRAILASRSEQGLLVRAYRDLTRRSGMATGPAFAGWAAWPDPGATAATA